MDVLIFLLLSSLAFAKTKSFHVTSNCPSIKSTNGFPGYEISCKKNKSIINFQSYGELEVKSISYDNKSVSLVDPKNCVHEVFLNLNLSGTPFKYYYELKEYRYLNCSAELPIPFSQVPCLSAPGIHVYVVETFLTIPDSCIAIKSIGIPFPYSPYLSDNTFGLRLTWDLTAVENNEASDLHSSDVQNEIGSLKRWIDIVYFKAIGLTMFIFMVVTLGILKTFYLDEGNKEKLMKPNAIEGKRLLGDCESLEPPTSCKATISVSNDTC